MADQPTPWRVVDEDFRVDALAELKAVPPPPPWPRRWLAAAGRLLRAAAAKVGPGDALFFLGLALLARGCWLLAPAAGWIVPGAVLLWYALPQRPRFLTPAPPKVITVNQPPQQGAGAPQEKRWGS